MTEKQQKFWVRFGGWGAAIAGYTTYELVYYFKYDKNIPTNVGMYWFMGGACAYVGFLLLYYKYKNRA